MVIRDGPLIDLSVTDLAPSAPLVRMEGGKMGLVLGKVYKTSLVGSARQRGWLGSAGGNTIEH